MSLKNWTTGDTVLSLSFAVATVAACICAALLRDEDWVLHAAGIVFWVVFFVCRAIGRRAKPATPAGITPAA